METDRIVETLVDAFWPDPLYRWLFHDGVVRTEALRANFATVVELALDRGIVDVARHGLGVAIWTEPGQDLFEDASWFTSLLERWAPHRHEPALAAIQECAQWAPESAAVLHLLAVSPRHTGQGIGSRLARSRLALIDRHGWTVHLESSSARNHSLYRRLGFRPVAEVDLASDGPRITPMTRRPGAEPARA